MTDKLIDINILDKIINISDDIDKNAYIIIYVAPSNHLTNIEIIIK